MPFEDTAIIISIVTTIVGIIGGGFGIITYFQNQTLKRQEIILPQMKEFDECKDLTIAKLLLDDFVFPAEDGKEYSKDNLAEVLRDHKIREVEGSEIDVRGSFDALLNFFGKLGYLIDIGVITRIELGYFRYYIDKAFDQSSVKNYAVTYEFELFAVLLDKMGMTLTLELRDLVNKYYERVRYKTKSSHIASILNPSL
jgi:hypothetical protein